MANNMDMGPIYSPMKEERELSMVYGMLGKE
jgi:hypothetical protein